MRALAADTASALNEPLAELGMRWNVGQRTGGTASVGARELLAAGHTVYGDEWHGLKGNERGVRVQLALMRPRHWNPQLGV